MTVCSVLIADSNARLARLLAELLADERDFAVLGVCSTPEQALEAAAADRPDVVLVSERLSGRPGVEVCATLRALLPDATLLLWSHHPARQPVGAVDGLLERGMTFRDLVDVVRRARGEATSATQHPARVRSHRSARSDDDPEGAMVVSCETCGLRRPIPTEDMPAAVVQARAFFTEHGGCVTSVDLSDQVSPDLLRG